MENNMIMGCCSHCGARLPLEHLYFTPETEAYYRNPTGHIPEGVDSSIMLCPTCLVKWEQEHKKKD